MFSNQEIPVQPFNFEDDKWDLRAINPNFDERDKGDFRASFSTIKPDWFKKNVKKYIYHLCKAGQCFGTISNRLMALRAFSRYLEKTSITGFEQINRSLIGSLVLCVISLTYTGAINLCVLCVFVVRSTRSPG
jgi:hypothetical protein